MSALKPHISHEGRVDPPSKRQAISYKLPQNSVKSGTGLTPLGCRVSTFSDMPLEYGIDFLCHLMPDILKAATYLLKYQGTLELPTLGKRKNLTWKVLQEWLKGKNDYKMYVQ